MKLLHEPKLLGYGIADSHLMWADLTLILKIVQKKDKIEVGCFGEDKDDDVVNSIHLTHHGNSGSRSFEKVD